MPGPVRAPHIPAPLPRPGSLLTPLSRLAIGLVLAAAVALLARRAGALTGGGAAAATVVGGLAIGAGWGWGGLLVLFFVLSTALSRVGAAAKERRTGAIVEKGGRRDAVQVLANGGVFALAAAAATALGPDPRLAAVGAGALAAAAADTWATEVGTLRGGIPRSVLTWRPVPVGTSGGVTAIGSLAAAAGAAAVALLAALLGVPAPPLAVAAGGAAGALADSLLGARLQARRRCPRCGTGTERIVHSCGARTVEAGGLTWMDNDVVNLLATVVGAGVALLLAAR